MPGETREVMGTPWGYTADGRFIDLTPVRGRELYRIYMIPPANAGISPVETLHTIMDRIEQQGEENLTEAEIMAFYEMHWPQILENMEGNIMAEDKDIITAENAVRTVEKVDRDALIGYLRTFGLIGGQDGLTDNEIGQFIEVAAAYNLNPFKREVYCIPYGKGDKRRLSIITGYETYLKRAERLGLLAGWRCWTEGEYQIVTEEKTFQGYNGPYKKTLKVARGNLTATVEIHRRDWTKPFTHTVDLDEYNQENEMWGKMPKTMLKKVATAQAFRLAFPDEMGGMPYSREELPDDMTTLRTVTDEHLDEGKHERPQAEASNTPHNPPPPPKAENYGVVIMAAKAKLIKLMTMQYNGVDLFEDDDKANVREKLKACAQMTKQDAAGFLENLAKVYERKAAKIQADIDDRQSQPEERPADLYEPEPELFDARPQEEIY